MQQQIKFYATEFTAVLIVTILVVICCFAYAQISGIPRTAARNLYNQGVSMWERGEAEEAIKVWENAYQIWPEAYIGDQLSSARNK